MSELLTLYRNAQRPYEKFIRYCATAPVGILPYYDMLLDQYSEADQIFVKRVLELEAKYSALTARIAELSQAVGLITTLKPTMLMDTEHPLDMAKEVAEYVTARIAELEAESERLTAHSDIEWQDDNYSNHTQTDAVVYGKWIPVSERLPEAYTRVLACSESGYMEVDYRFAEPIVDVGIAEFYSLDNITHWMPLPTPPEVQE